MIASTATRVSDNTDQSINDRIRCQIQANIDWYSSQGPEAVARRLEELNQEWDIERIIETVAPIITMTGLCLGVRYSPRWLLVPAVIQTFFLQHAIQGWCPPIPVLRRLGVRTIQEIDSERYGLMARRGDFKNVVEESRPAFRRSSPM
jgi:hypothetical protein